MMRDTCDDPGLLLVDDDPVLREKLGEALQRRAFKVMTARDHASALALAAGDPPDFAVIDVRLGDSSGLVLVPALLELNPRARIVMLTGYGSIAGAIDAIKLGATYYLSKPVCADDIVDAFHHYGSGVEETPPHEPNTMSLRRATWEHLSRVLHQNKGNISATARALSMHRRTLQRKLAKRPVAR